MAPFETVLILLVVIGLFIFFYYLGKRMANQEWVLQKVPLVREDAITRSRAVLGGQFSEQLAPYLPNFPYSPSEVRFLGKPIDFLVFKGMDGKNIREVVFVEVKSGRSRLSPVEASLRDAIEKKHISWESYTVPEALTKKEK